MHSIAYPYRALPIDCTRQICRDLGDSSESLHPHPERTGGQRIASIGDPSSAHGVITCVGFSAYKNCAIKFLVSRGHLMRDCDLKSCSSVAAAGAFQKPSDHARDCPASRCRPMQVEPSVTNIAVCRQEREVDEAAFPARLSPDITRFKWRKQQFLAQQRIAQLIAKEDAQSRLRHTWPWNAHHRNELINHFVQSHCKSSDPSFQAQPNDLEGHSSASKVSSEPCSDGRSHAIWSGWLRFYDGGLKAFFRSWRAFWCVLNVQRDELRLDLIELDTMLGSTRLKRSIVLDSSDVADYDSYLWQCSACVRLSIRERGSRRRHRAMCESPEEAERLLSCLNAVLKSSRRPCR